MEIIVTKFIESLGVPGIILAVIYLIWQKKIISIIMASDIERKFFTHEKWSIYKLFNSIGLFLLTFLLFIFISEWVVNKKTYFNIPIVIHSAYMIVIIFAVSSFIMHVFKDKNTALLIKQFLSKNESSITITIGIFYTMLIGCFVYIVISSIYSKNLVENKDNVILVNSFLISLLTPGLITKLIKAWLNLGDNYFYYLEGDKKWYILKSYDNEVLVGDNPIEEKCEKLRFVELSELKKNEIIKKRYDCRADALSNIEITT